MTATAHPWAHVPAALRPLRDHTECGICADCIDGRFYRCSDCWCPDCREYYDDVARDAAAEARSEMERGR